MTSSACHGRGGMWTPCVTPAGVVQPVRLIHAIVHGYPDGDGCFHPIPFRDHPALQSRILEEGATLLRKSSLIELADGGRRQVPRHSRPAARWRPAPVRPGFQ